MKILWPDIHVTLTRSIALATQKLGHELLIPSSEYVCTHYPNAPVQRFTWREDWTQEMADKEIGVSNVRVVSKEEILDIKPEIVFITAYENQYEILREIWPFLSGSSKLVFYSGNDYWEDAYPWYMIENYLCADNLALSLCQKYDKHFLNYRPWIDYDKFSFDGTSDGNMLGSYVTDYENTFPKEYAFVKHLQKECPYIDFKINVDSTKEEVAQCMKDSVGTIHVKGLEGYGFAIIESMARGRPVFLHRELTDGKVQNMNVQRAYLNWAIENNTALFFGNPLEFMAKSKALIECEEYRHFTQKSCSITIRKLINNEEQTEYLRQFLENLL